GDQEEEDGGETGEAAAGDSLDPVDGVLAGGGAGRGEGGARPGAFDPPFVGGDPGGGGGTPQSEKTRRAGGGRLHARPAWCPLEDPDRAGARGSLSALAGLDDDLALLNVADQVESLGRAPLLLPLRGQADVGKGLLDPVHDLDVVAVDRVEAGDRLLVAEAD